MGKNRTVGGKSYECFYYQLENLKSHYKMIENNPKSFLYHLNFKLENIHTS